MFNYLSIFIFTLVVAIFGDATTCNRFWFGAFRFFVFFVVFDVLVLISELYVEHFNFIVVFVDVISGCILFYWCIKVNKHRLKAKRIMDSWNESFREHHEHMEYTNKMYWHYEKMGLRWLDKNGNLIFTRWTNDEPKSYD